MPRRSELFGSVFAFTCFIYALKTLPTTLVMTYSYVNPVIAVFLGWLLIDEPVTIFTFVGTVLIIAGVYGVFREKAGGHEKDPRSADA
jgi:drug/metabolite transporter (DMT)-like permease